MDKPAASRDDVIAALLPYVSGNWLPALTWNHITRHILGLYQGVPGARKFRRHSARTPTGKPPGSRY